MANTRRRNGVTQTSYSQFAHPPEVAEPIHPTYLGPQTGYDSAWSANGNFVHPDPLVDNSHDSIMAPPPASLSLSVPGAGSYASSLLYSPSSDGYQSQSNDQSPLLPSYDGSHLDTTSSWTNKLDPSLYSLSPSEPSSKSRFDNHFESEVKTKDLSAASQQAAMSHMSPKERTAHRKAIEEKSSMKRKLAEQRLSRAITSRLGGTFVPGLANQMNQAADIIERDAQTIQALEAEVKRLRGSVNDVQMKFK